MNESQKIEMIKRFKNWDRGNSEVRPEDQIIIDEINSLSPERVLDVGCGQNLLSGLIDNLIGLDLINKNADIICDILDSDFPDSHFDAILSLNALHFGEVEDFCERIEKIVPMLRPGAKLYVKLNPSLDDETSSSDSGGTLLRAPIRPSHIRELSEKLGLEIIGPIKFFPRRLPGKARSKGSLSFTYQNPLIKD